MFILALTGSIATGKSTILAMFKDEGIPTVSADEVVKDLYKKEAVKPISQVFPKSIKNGVIEKHALSSLLIAQPEKFRALEAIIHPLVQKRLQQFIKAQQKAGKILVVIEIPLLFETKNKYDFDAILVSHVDEKTQTKRALKRDSMSKEKLEMILAKQVPQKEKLKKADFTIDSSNSLQETKSQVKEIISTILSKQNRLKNDT